MAGHSKWANIRHRKAAQDAKRGKIFTKLIRELVVAAKSGGEPADNPRLRAAMDKALGANMKRDTIDKAIARGVGNGEGDQYEEITYEGYGVSGVAVLVECMTDNRNRTVSDVRHAFTKHGGNLGTDGSVAYLFTKQGQFLFDASEDEEALMELALELGADDVISHKDDTIEVITPFEAFSSCQSVLERAGFKALNAEISMVPSTLVALDAESAAKILTLVDVLEDLDDVQNVFTNAEISEEILNSLD